MLRPEKRNPAGRPGFESVQTTGSGPPTNSSSTPIQASTTPNVDIMLSRLDRVRKSGTGWTARCPAHKDRNASLSVGVGSEGKIVVAHCFAGCAIHDVLTAIGLSVGDLYPRRLRDLSPEGRRQARRLATIADWSAALGVLEREAGVVLIAGGDLANEKPLTLPDHQRLALAIQRIEAARLVLIGGRRD